MEPPYAVQVFEAHAHLVHKRNTNSKVYCVLRSDDIVKRALPSKRLGHHPHVFEPGAVKFRVASLINNFLQLDYKLAPLRFC